METQATKIFYLITKSNWGGAQRYVFDMATASKRQGFDVVVGHGQSGEMAERLTNAGVRCIQIQALERDVRPDREIRAFFALLKTLRAERPDILHLNSSKAGALGGVAGRIAGIKKIIFTAHGWALNEERPFWQKIPIAIVYYITLLCAHTTIAVSGKIRRDVGWMLFVRKKIFVIRNGIDAPLFLEKSEARNALYPGHTGGFWIGIAAELHPVKRITDAIDAFAQIKIPVPESMLFIMGEGSERKKLENQIVRLGLRGRVVLLGHVKNASSYMKAFDLCMLVSRSEGLAYAVLEAGLAGLPVIATNVGGLPEIIEDKKTGLLVPPEMPPQLTKAIECCMQDQAARERMGAALQEKVMREFSVERMVTQTLALYK